MAVFILWANGGGTPKYQGKVGGGLWDQFIVNAKAGHGDAYFIEATSAADAKAKVDQCKPSSIKNVYVYGGEAETALRGKKSMALQRRRKSMDDPDDVPGYEEYQNKPGMQGDPEDISDVVPGDEEYDKDFDDQEPHGAQVLRRLHQDSSLLMPDYDKMMGPLEDQEVKKHLQKKLEEHADHLDTVEDLWGKKYAHLPPLAGAKDIEGEEEEPEEDEGGTLEADSEEEELPNEEEAVEGMKSFHRRVKRLRRKVKYMGGSARGVAVKERAPGVFVLTAFGQEMPNAWHSNSRGEFYSREEAEYSAKQLRKALEDEEEEKCFKDIDGGYCGMGEKELEPHEESKINEAKDYLKDLSEQDGFSTEDQHKSYHFHKALEPIARKGMGDDVMGMMGEGALDDEEKEEKFVGDLNWLKEEDSEKDLDDEEKEEKRLKRLRKALEDEEEKRLKRLRKDLEEEEEKRLHHKGMDDEEEEKRLKRLRKAIEDEEEKRLRRKGMDDEEYEHKDGDIEIPNPMEGDEIQGKSMHYKAINDASQHFKELSEIEPHEFSDEHRGKCLHHGEELGKALEGLQSPPNANDPQDIPGDEEFQTKPGMPASESDFSMKACRGPQCETDDSQFDNLNPGTLVDAGPYGRQYIVARKTGGYLASPNQADIAANRGRFLSSGHIEKVISGGKSFNRKYYNTIKQESIKQNRALKKLSHTINQVLKKMG